MAAALAHRGPDGEGIEVVGSVGLVHRRLAIVDPSEAGRQPMASADGRWWLTYNGEVFNHLALRRELDGVPWRGGSDTETLVEGLARCGEHVVERCNGLFGFAALDVQGRRLLLSRDRWGVKPLYVAWHDGALWFASEVRALLAAGLPRSADADILAHYVVHGWAVGSGTPFTAVERLHPGSTLTVDLDTLTTSQRTWYDPVDVVDAERIAALAIRGRAELCDAVEDELRAAVHRRLMADVPVGTMCSGGIDSSLVTAFARERKSGVVAFNASVVDQPEADEGPWATRVAQHLGVELRTVPMTADRWRSDFVQTVRHNEYPLLHESSVPMSQIAGLARDGGVKVLLSGEGADELFGGYGFLHAGRYLAYLRAHRRGHALLELALGKVRRDGIVGLLRGRLADGGPDTVQPLDAGVRDDGGPYPAPGASAAADAAYTEARGRAWDAYANSDSTSRALESELLSELRTYLPHLLNRQDKNTMQSSVETRVPFLDPEFVSLVLNLPLRVRMEPARKGVLRDLSRRHLPRGVAERPKVGFGFDVRPYLVPAAHEEFLRDGALRELLGVGSRAWAHAIAEGDSGRALRLWSGEVWCRTMLEDQSVERVEAELWR